MARTRAQTKKVSGAVLPEVRKRPTSGIGPKKKQATENVVSQPTVRILQRRVSGGAGRKPADTAMPLSLPQTIAGQSVASRTLRRRSVKSSLGVSTVPESGVKSSSGKLAESPASSSVENDGHGGQEITPEKMSLSVIRDVPMKFQSDNVANSRKLTKDTSGSGKPTVRGRQKVSSQPNTAQRMNQSSLEAEKNHSSAPFRSTSRKSGDTDRKKSRSSVVGDDKSSSRLNSSLRPRKSATASGPAVLDESSDFDDNLDFDFSDKDSDFDVSKELEKRPKKKRNIDVESESSGEDEWEAVAERESGSDNEDTLEQYSAAKAPVGIMVTMPNGEKKGMSMEKWLAARLRKREREIRGNIHAVHLLGCMAHGRYLSETLGLNETLLGLALSLWDKSHFLTRSQILKLDESRLQDMITFIKSRISLSTDSGTPGMSSISALTTCMLDGRCRSYLHLILVILLMLRSLSIEVRLVYSMQPLAAKEAKSSGIAGKSGKKSGKVENGKSSNRKRRRSTDDEECLASDPDTKQATTSTRKPVKRYRERMSPKLDGSDLEDSDAESDADLEDVAREGKKGVPRRSEKEGQPEPVPATADLAVVETSKIMTADAVNLVKQLSKDRGVDYWLEVYCPKSKAFIPVHCIHGQIGQPEEIEKTATQPIQYVVAFGDPRTMKDVTSRYCADWLTTGRKRQLDAAWFAETLRPYHERNRKRAEEEDSQIRDLLLKRPRPLQPNLYRGHPLYVLRSHLAKYESLYPPNPLPVGEVKDEPIYLRDCVALLHTRENWLREAKSVKSGEVPYKEVKKIQRKKKSRKPRNDPNAILMAEIAEKEPSKPEMVGLFGEWQVEDFVPPVAENGIVPRNSYNNVELYKPEMLPIGCVYIPIPGINRLARKMDIDCVAAVTGWEFSGWRAHPVLDGYVVCQEFEKKLLKAWEKEKVEIEKKKIAKKSQKAMDNWRKIIKNLFMRKKLQIKYGVDHEGSGKLMQSINKTSLQVESDSD